MHRRKLWRNRLGFAERQARRNLRHCLGKEITNLDIGRLLRLPKKPEKPIKLVDERPMHDFRYSLNAAEAKELDWVLKGSLEEYLRSAVDSYVSNEL